MNAMWVTAQVFAYDDANFDVFECAEVCGVDTRAPPDRPRSGVIPVGFKHAADAWEPHDGQ